MAQMPRKFLFPTSPDQHLRVFPDREGRLHATESVEGNLAHKFLAQDVNAPELGLVCLIVFDYDLAMCIHNAAFALFNEPGGKMENMNPRSEGHAFDISAGSVELDREKLYPGLELTEELPHLADLKIQTKQ